MAWSKEEDDRPDQDEGDDELGENDYKAQKDAVLFAIDVSKSMLQPSSGDGDAPVAAALKSAYLLMKQRIISQPKDMMGILLFGTKKSKLREGGAGSDSQYPHCYLHTDLGIPSAQVVRALKSLAEEGEDPDGILEPSGKEPPMTPMLFCANNVFTTNAPNFGSRRLFIITDNDDPFSGNKEKKNQAAVRAKDLFDLGVTIELFPLGRPGRDTFDVAKFYSDVIYLDPLSVADRDAAAADGTVDDDFKVLQAGDGVSLLHSLLSNINAKQTPKRAYFSNMSFELAPGMTISVNGYLVLHRQVIHRSCYVYLANDDAPPQIAQGSTTKTEDGSVRTVEKSEIKKAHKFGTGGDFVYFSPEELEQLRKFEKDAKCLRLIGFKPRSMLPPWAAVKKSHFVFPTEAGYVGSTRVFSALWKKLLESDKMGIAWYIPRKNAVPQIVAILPSKKQSDDESGTPFLPAGLWLTPLPFVDDLRDLTQLRQSNMVRASDELINKMRMIVGNLKLPKNMYDPSKYPNPGLQRHYQVLQSIALDEDIPDVPPDLTKPKYKQINKRVGGYQADFKETLKQEAQLAMQQAALKREATEEADQNDRPAKKPRPAAKKVDASIMTSRELNEAVRDGTLAKRTVAVLKATCLDMGLSVAGKKADLVERMEEWVERQ